MAIPIILFCSAIALLLGEILFGVVTTLPRWVVLALRTIGLSLAALAIILGIGIIDASGASRPTNDDERYFPAY